MPALKPQRIGGAWVPGRHGPACARCGLVMNAGLHEQGWRIHPCCDPPRPATAGKPAVLAVELYCLACQLGPAACSCRAAGLRPRLWQPEDADLPMMGQRIRELLTGETAKEKEAA